MDHTIKEIQKDPKGDHALHQGLMALVYKVLKGKSIEKSIKGKYVRNEDTKSEASGFNFDSETKGDLEETSKKGRNKAKRKRIVVDLDISESKAELFEGKFIKKKEGKVTGKQIQRKKTSKESNKDINQILIDSEEEAEENKKDEGQDKEGEDNQVTNNVEGLNAQGMQKEEQEDKSGKLSDCVDENATIKGFCETVGTMVKDIGSLKKDTLTVKIATIGKKPLTQNVKELVVAINNVEATESMVGKIITTEKKINRFENNTEKDVDKEQLDKKGHEKRTRANTRNKGDIKGHELEELKTSTDNMKLMDVHAEDIMKSI
ncbi:methyl-CpG-binding domain-containing protein 10-like [Cryptomeria japonica]|uniref:methyl-CpG-binding domain-containing protein 10-like n=1 Tax=Cryptomeria japonica TaxID=3369 RepID=UPI0027DA74D9|nr:methyl-CpG-binding domain-containing protein 10-like [Cryptomeria japonica]